MKENKNFSKNHIASVVLCVLALLALFLPISTGNGMFSFSGQYSYNIVNVAALLFAPDAVVTSSMPAFKVSFLMSCIGLLAVAVALIVLIVLTFKKVKVGVRRILAVCILFTALFMGFLFNTNLTNVAKEVTNRDTNTGVVTVVKENNNFYGVSPDFKIKVSVLDGSVNKWKEPIAALQDALEKEFPGEDISDKKTELNRLYEYAGTFGYGDGKSASDYKKANKSILADIQKLIPVERQEEIFARYFGGMTKSVSAITSTYGVGYLVLLVILIALCGVCYTERSAEGYKNNGIPANCMFAGLMLLLLVLTLIYPMFGVASVTTGLNKLSLLVALIALPFAGKTGILNGADQTMLILALVLFLLSIVHMAAFIVCAMKKKEFALRRVFGVVNFVLYFAAGLLATDAFGTSGVTLDGFYFLLIGIAIAAAIIPFTVYSDKERFKVFSVINVILFLLICAFIIVPLWKVLVDSFDAQAGYGMRMWPKEFSTVGYQIILSTESMRKPFLISVLVTVCGTILGLLLSTLGAYVLIQFEMPGRNFLAGLLLFTMIFQAGMIPTYLVMSNLQLTNTLWVVILLPAINVYNLVLMRNFFEGIPKSLFESASIDGCTPMGIFIKIVLPLSKAALASIGLMFAVAYWNDYTNYKLYITETGLHNFQMKLRALFFSSDLPEASAGANTDTLKNASIMVAILPFMIAYPFLQKYFVKGVNVGAVKE